MREGACLTIADVTSATGVTLPNADLRDDGRFGRHRAVAFDDTGTRLLYLRNGKAHEVVLRDLTTGAESTVDAGSGLVWSARFARGRQGLVLHVIPSGEWPVYVTSLAPRSCRGSVGSFSAFGSRTARSVIRLVPLSNGTPMEGEDIIAPFAGRALVRRKNGALALRSAEGNETSLVSARCGGQIQHLDSVRHILLVTCKGTKSRGEVGLWLYGPRGARKLGDIHAREEDDLSDTGERVVAVGDTYVDVESGRIVPAPPIARGTVRITRTWEEREAGHFAERWDGAVLTQDEQGDYTVPPGPLHWRRP